MKDDANASGFTVEFTPEFKRNLRALAKKYRSIRSDVQGAIDQILKGVFIGNQIPKTGDYSPYAAYKQQ